MVFGCRLTKLHLGTCEGDFNIQALRQFKIKIKLKKLNGYKIVL